MRVIWLTGADKGKVRDMPTKMARKALKVGSVELVSKDVCQRCGGLYEEVPTLKSQPAQFVCKVCGSAFTEAAPSESEAKQTAGRRSARARRAGTES